MRLLRWTACAALVASATFVGSPPAAGFVGVCTAGGFVTASPGLTVAPGFATFTITLGFSCPVGFDHAGSWGVNAFATSGTASCATVGAGSGGFVSGGGPDGSVTGGGFSFTSAGPVVLVSGSLSTSGDVLPHQFTAELFAQPTGPICGGGPSTFALSGTVTIVDGISPTLNPEPGTAVCTVAMLRHYAAGVTVMPVSQGGVGVASLNCAGLGPEAGAWNFSFTTGGTESCGAGLSTLTITGGNTSSHGTILSGSIDDVRVGHHGVLTGTILTSAEPAPHRFNAMVAWVPAGSTICGLAPVFTGMSSGPGAIVDG